MLYPSCYPHGSPSTPKIQDNQGRPIHAMSAFSSFIFVENHQSPSSRPERITIKDRSTAIWTGNPSKCRFCRPCSNARGSNVQRIVGMGGRRMCDESERSAWEVMLEIGSTRERALNNRETILNPQPSTWEQRKPHDPRYGVPRSSARSISAHTLLPRKFYSQGCCCSL